MLSSNIIFETCLLEKNFERDEFDCGNEGLNTYLKTYASQDHKRGLARVFVLVDQQDVIQGYYTLSAGNVSFEHLPPNISKKIPKYPIPVALIGRLAINGTYQKKGLGRYLLIDAFKRILDVNKQLAIFAVVVDAKDEAAKKFYESHDFLAFKNEKFKLFIEMETIKKLFIPV